MRCDLQLPCSKCQTRGRECIYVSGHSVPGSSAGSQHASTQEAKVHDAFDEELAKLLANPSLASSSTARTPDSYLHQLAVPIASARTARSPAHALPPASTLSATYTSGAVDFAIASSSIFALIDNPEAAQSSMQNDKHDLFGSSGGLSGELFDDFLGGAFAPSQQMMPDFGLDGKGKDVAGTFPDFTSSQGSDASLASTPFPAALFDIPAMQPSTGNPHVFDSSSIAGPSSTSSSSPGSSGDSSTPSSSSKESITDRPDGPTPACRLTYCTSLRTLRHCPCTYAPSQCLYSLEHTFPICQSSMLLRLYERGDIHS